MSKKSDSRNLEQLLAEADELFQQINSDVVKDLEEDHRMQFEKHAQNLEKIKSRVQSGTGKGKVSETDSGADDMHEAILDIVKAMGNLKNRIL
jgi:vacuolar-type H+-ATPase subunit H